MPLPSATLGAVPQADNLLPLVKMEEDAGTSEAEAPVLHIKKEEEPDCVHYLNPWEGLTPMFTDKGVEHFACGRMAGPGTLSEQQIQFFIRFLHREGYDNIPPGTPRIQSLKRNIMQRLRRSLRRHFNVHVSLRVVQRIWSDLKRRHPDLVEQLLKEVEAEWIQYDPSADGAATEGAEEAAEEEAAAEWAEEEAVAEPAGPPAAPTPSPREAPQLPQVVHAATQTEDNLLHHILRELQDIKDLVLNLRGTVPLPPPATF
ncbi:uncharacterized protein LOC121394832 [Xenopus laevis]|uniref:Uncharacterized protein LOC121394832 n=1 Tax=Xenopus laevis TaxID=8355 RepID=A0A8J1L039_XENLA|nr:uncharacterized protein LOC121394832 [Xenopus laevis]